jgi:hypothetical protein
MRGKWKTAFWARQQVGGGRTGVGSAGGGDEKVKNTYRWGTQFTLGAGRNSELQWGSSGALLKATRTAAGARGAAEAAPSVAAAPGPRQPLPPRCRRCARCRRRRVPLLHLRQRLPLLRLVVRVVAPKQARQRRGSVRARGGGAAGIPNEVKAPLPSRHLARLPAPLQVDQVKHVLRF